MRAEFNPLELSPTGYPTKITFFGGEGFQWVAEINAKVHDGSEMRVRLIFGGTAQVRIGAYEDIALQGSYLLTSVQNSSWIAEHLDAYVNKFGSQLLPIVKNVKHYVLRGHDFSIGLISKDVECVAIEEDE